MTAAPTKRPFAVGERVAVYPPSGRFVGTVTDAKGDTVEIDGRTVAHVKACRRLKPKPARKPRRIWLPENAIHQQFVRVLKSPDEPIDGVHVTPKLVEFVEKLPRRRKKGELK